MLLRLLSITALIFSRHVLTLYCRKQAMAVCYDLLFAVRGSVAK